jgi:hypothetical protein
MAQRTRTFLCLQVWHAFDLPGTPTIVPVLALSNLFQRQHGRKQLGEGTARGQRGRNDCQRVRIGIEAPRAHVETRMQAIIHAVASDVVAA